MIRSTFEKDTEGIICADGGSEIFSISKELPGNFPRKKETPAKQTFTPSKVRNSIRSRNRQRVEENVYKVSKKSHT